MDLRKKKIAIALMLAMFLGAVEGTVVTTAIPTIAKELHGFEIISLVFSSYLLTSAISTPICGKLSDLYGRKNVLSIGIIIFLIGSFLCGLSQSMFMLIGFRAIQGIGAGSVFTVSYTIVGDVYNIEERPKIQGILGTVWGIASLVGPFLGGTLIDVLSWHWIFFINIPFGILSIILLHRSLKEDFEKRKHNLDYAGVFTLSAALILFLSIFLATDINKLLIGISVVLTILLLVLFYLIERRVNEPIIPFDIFNWNSVIVNMISLFIAAVLIGINVYIPIYLQNILGLSATVSGLALVSMSFSWLLASFVLGNRIVKNGGKQVNLISVIILLVGIILLSTLGINSPLALVLVYVFIIGFGFGGAFTVLTIIIQESVDYTKRGAAIGANALLKTLGQTIGVSVFGNIFNINIVRYFNRIGLKDINPNDLYGSSAQNLLISSDRIKLSLNNSMFVLFITFIVLTGISLILSVILPEKSAEV
ncbi:MDR family MFS transporter [Anaerocolumna sp. MB42-C2]|uniref:MDR family MFS transporter n=1 Tax=Anaerocolumna sp. MB42-C2 TaxID=3070997 RepID=UPI0027DF97BF|nr:MDR family MFS transporter [Anaerocolumna sp. MB42-C2]WMJ88220.1 MDR family MFS transporter [Anaerocolumna sp. MB42-C2]